MSLLIYIIKTIFISGGLLGYYWLFLRNRPIHTFNRCFLLSIPFLSLAIPLLHFELTGFFLRSTDSAIHLLGVANGTLDEAVTIYGHRAGGLGMNWTIIALIGYALVSGWFFASIFQTILYLRRLRIKNPSVKMPEASLYFVKEKGTPFSFFQSIFWEKDQPLNSPSSAQILRHELFHVKQWHSLDLMMIEILSGMIWFNPFLHLLRRELKLIHEYSADAYAAAGSDAFDYASLLVWHISGSPGRLTHPFFKTHIKRRITMIIKNKNRKTSFLGRLLFLPVMLFMFGLFAFHLPDHLSFSPVKKMRVVIDAGHGGIDPGKMMNNIQEKNINLLIAKKIQLLAGTYGIEVVMTRETDDLPGQGDNIGKALKFRTELPEKEHADLFVSIHVNSTDENRSQETRSGFDIYVPGANNTVHGGSVKLASAVAAQIKPDYTVAAELKERAGRIQILDNATVPSILIECGYLDNAMDLKYLQDDQHREKIARDILEGIQKYGQQFTTYETTTHENRELTKNQTLTENVILTEKVTRHDSSSPRKKVEVEAEYPGGSEAWVQYLIKKCVYPPAAEKNEVQGEVQVEFVVNTSGKISGVRAISGPDVLRTESVRLIKESGKWVPAMDKGKKVSSYKIQPINFKLEEH